MQQICLFLCESVWKRERFFFNSKIFFELTGTDWSLKLQKESWNLYLYLWLAYVLNFRLPKLKIDSGQCKSMGHETILKAKES